jgi:hypothetical protein
MGKYDPLGTFLRRQRHDAVSLTFRDIERIIGGILPKASADPAWWTVDGSGGAVPHASAWTSARFAPEVDFKNELVRFVRMGDAAARLSADG